MAGIILLSMKEKTNSEKDKIRFILDIEEELSANKFYIVGDDLIRVYYNQLHIPPNIINNLLNYIRKHPYYNQTVIDMLYTTNLHQK